MNFKNFIYPFAISSLLLFNCSSGGDDPVSQPGPDPNPNPTPSTKVTYNGNIKSIIDSRCLSCHGSSPSNGANFSLTTYTQVKNRVDAIITRVSATANPMPPSPNSPLTQAQKDLIQQWKTDGLLEN